MDSTEENAPNAMVSIKNIKVEPVEMEAWNDSNMSSDSPYPPPPPETIRYEDAVSWKKKLSAAEWIITELESKVKSVEAENQRLNRVIIEERGNYCGTRKLDWERFDKFRIDQNKRLNAQRHQFESTDWQLKGLQAEYVKVRRIVEERESALKVASRKIYELQISRQDLENRFAQLGLANEAMHANVMEKREELSRAEDKIKSLEEGNKKLLAEMSTKNGVLTKCKKQLAARNTEIGNLKVNNVLAENKLKKLRDDVAQVNATLKEANEKFVKDYGIVSLEVILSDVDRTGQKDPVKLLESNLQNLSYIIRDTFQDWVKCQGVQVEGLRAENVDNVRI